MPQTVCYRSRKVITIGGMRSIGAGRTILVSAVSFNAFNTDKSQVTLVTSLLMLQPSSGQIVGGPPE